jgi:outer membrane protein assembly factor BamB
MPSVDQLIFVGLNGWVAALDRDSGEVVWYNSKLDSGYTTLLLDGDRLIVSTNGYIYCLDPQNGRIVWRNPMRGYGTGVAHLVSVRGQSPQGLLAQAAAAEAQKSAAHAAHVPHAGS